MSFFHTSLGQSWLAHGGSSSLLCPSQTFSLLQHGCFSQAVGKSLPWCWAAPLLPHLLTLVLHLLLLTLFVLSSSLSVVSKFPYKCFPWVTAVMAAGLSCALKWVPWSHLEPAVSSPGLPLTGVTLQPPPAPGHLQCCAPAQLITKELLTQTFWAPPH